MGHLRKCTLKDLHHVSENMRDMDRLEAVYQTGQDPDTALRVSYLASKIVMAICGDDDNPIGICGVTKWCVYIWLLQKNYFLMINIKYN